MTAATINSDTSLQQAIGDLREAYRAHKFIRLNWTTGKARSLDQNAISHTWYDQISRELREETPLGVKCFCKLHYGVPILRAENEDFRAQYDTVLKPLSYDKKLLAMNFLPVTSLMTKPQLSQYLEAIQSAYADRVNLEFPEQEAV
jgi:hypothetical protein